MSTWRQIPDLPSYEASEDGEIRRIRHGREPLILTQSLKEDGYWRVAVWIDGKRLWKPVNRLVCLALHGPAPRPDSMACHNDGCKDNNTHGNIYWGTAKSNYDDAVRHGTAHIMPLPEIPDGDLREWFNRDRVLNRKSLSDYERGKFGGIRSAKQRTSMRKEAISRGYNGLARW